jgi:hypothetical protein
MSVSPSSSRAVSRRVLTFVGLLLCAGSLAGLLVLWRTTGARIQTFRAWSPVSCTVMRAETITKGTDIDGHLLMDPAVEVAWEVSGTRYTGGGIDADIGYYRAESINEKEAFCHRLRTDPAPLCHVNPDNPAEAILRLPGWDLPSIFAGLLGAVAIVGAGIAFAAGEKTPSGGPGRRAFALVILMGLLLLAAGAAFCWPRTEGRLDWDAIGPRLTEVDCTVVSATVQRHGGGRRSVATYRPVVYYRYEQGGRSWHSQWYDFDESAPDSSDENEAKALLEPYSTNSRQRCWVDPQQPWVAVLKKSGGTFNGLWIPGAICLLAGASLVVLGLRKLRSLRRAAALAGFGDPN